MACVGVSTVKKRTHGDKEGTEPQSTDAMTWN